MRWLTRRQLNLNGDSFVDPVTAEIVRMKSFDHGGLRFWLMKIPLTVVKIYAVPWRGARPTFKIVPLVEPDAVQISGSPCVDKKEYTVEHIESFRIRNIRGVWTYEYYLKWVEFMS